MTDTGLRPQDRHGQGGGAVLRVGNPASGPQPADSAVAFAALTFLAIPLVVFFVGFSAWYVAVPAVSSIAVTLYRVRPVRLDAPVSARQVLSCIVLSGLFLWACGYSPPFGRSWDWLKHFALINELARNPWPPVNPATHTFLRYALGYHLMPGLAARVLGEWVIVPAVFLQTWAGLSLVLVLLLVKIRPLRSLPFLLVFLLFGGLDLVGWAVFGSDRSLLSTKEWWTGRSYLFAYEGNATLFLWVPQHALAGMLGVLLLLSDDGRPASPRSLGLLGAAVLFWSPFAAIGLAPFALVAAARAGRAVFADAGNIVCGLMLGIPLLAYLTAGSGEIPHGATFAEPRLSVAMYAVFLALEVGLYLLALRWCGWRHLRHSLLVTALLLVFPLYRIGVYNDFAMRASIPALTLLAAAVAAAVTGAGSRARIALAVLVAIGAAGSALEIIGRGQDGTVSVRDQTMRSGFLFRDRRYFVQYNAPLPNWVLGR